MSNYSSIVSKLESFIRKYYTNELIKGVFLFFSIGVFYFLILLLIEHMLWLNIAGRTILFWLFVLVELLLFYRFIAVPLARLFKLQKGIGYEEASKIIGSHFPEVQDKLLNVLQLQQQEQETELLTASIQQKSEALTPIPFNIAINFRKSIAYLKYALLPLFIILLIYFSGNFNGFTNSYKRVVNYQTAYQPPAPFAFFVVNDNLSTLENTNFTLKVNVVGKTLPENVKINYDNESYYLQQDSIGFFSYIFEKPKTSTTFHFSANTVSSKNYTLEVLPVPEIVNFHLQLHYPSYTNKPKETLQSIGNKVVPNGTRITWQVNTKATSKVTFNTTNDTIAFTTNEKNSYQFSKQVFNTLPYSISTSNSTSKNYENLGFIIDVVPDEYPQLFVEMKTDSTNLETLYFSGQASDDYGLRALKMAYYPTEQEHLKKTVPLPLNAATITSFITAFPLEQNLEEGVSYSVYFEVIDNDAIANYKSVKSKVYAYRKNTAQEQEEKQLQEQKSTIEDLNKSLENLEENKEDLQELSKTQKENKTLNFNEKRKLENFLERQKQQEELMQQFNQELQENLEEFQEENKDDSFKEELQNRLQENEEQLKEDEKLLDELQKYKDKLEKEQLTEKLEELAKQQKNQKRSLEQLLELTKRYYVAKKQEKIAQDLEELAKEQKELSTKNQEENTSEEQEKLNKKFNKIAEAIKDLEKENESLKKPMDIPKSDSTQEEIQQEQDKAKEHLQEQEKSNNQQEQNNQQQKAQKRQKNAAKKMQQMSGHMQQAMLQSMEQGEEEDAKSLRQILDNLLKFSFNQEDLMYTFKNTTINDNKYANYLKQQFVLREHFEHVDDSLFALSLRQPKISEIINKEITEIYFNIDKSLSQFSENQIYKGISSQQYTITATNTLADLLSNTLNNMQMQMMGTGKGGGNSEEGLPDIIKSQEELNKEAEEGSKPQNSGAPKEGEEGDKEGQESKGQNGNQKGGESGNSGQSQNNTGKDGNKQGNQEGLSEQQSAEIFEIYKRQQQIKQALKDKLSKEGINPEGNSLIRQMEQVERELLNKGITKRTLQKMKHLEHQLLKLENAIMQQGKETKRESKSNTKKFSNPTTNPIDTAKKYFNTTEILNKENLPMQPLYKKKVQNYFKIDTTN